MGATAGGTYAGMCPGPGCTNPAVEGMKYCSKRCRMNYNAKMHRRRKGQMSKEETIAAMAEMTCPKCGGEFMPTGLKQVYCGTDCRNAAGKDARREAAKHLPKDAREQCLAMLDFATVGNVGDSTKRIDWELFSWVRKEDHYKTDHRRPETHAIIAEAKRYLESEGEMSMRFMFYHLVSVQMIANTPAQYARLAAMMTIARERGDLPSNAFTDNLRESITYHVDRSIEDFKATVAGYYKIDLWKNQERLIEIWTEKDSIVSVVDRTVREFKVPLRVLRGQGSTPYLDGIARELCRTTKPIYIFYLGDHDPAGYCIEDSARSRLYAFLMEEQGWTSEHVSRIFRWKRIGFLHEDFDAHNIDALPEDDKMQGLESFLERFGDGRKAELEGLEPDEIRRRLRSAIVVTMGPDGIRQREEDLATEDAERRQLNRELGVGN